MPAGKASIESMISMIRTAGVGSCSEGFRMNALPHASANGRNHSGIIAGKLNGVIAATTPTGWRSMCTSTPRATRSRFSPLSRCGAAIAASTDSIPRPTSAFASSSVFPMSWVTSAAISSWWARSSCCRRISARARTRGEVSRQAGNAARAARTAASTSPAPLRGTRASVSPLAGSSESSVVCALGWIHLPPT